jgi:hypothetical protein
VREEKYRSPFYYDMDPFERLVHNTASPYAAENMYWSRKSMEMWNTYRRNDEEYYYNNYRGNSTSSGNSKIGLIVILATLMYFFLMIFAFPFLSNMPHP